MDNKKTKNNEQFFRPNKRQHSNNRRNTKNNREEESKEEAKENVTTNKETGGGAKTQRGMVGVDEKQEIDTFAKKTKIEKLEIENRIAKELLEFNSKKNIEKILETEYNLKNTATKKIIEKVYWIIVENFSIKTKEAYLKQMLYRSDRYHEMLEESKRDNVEKVKVHLQNDKQKAELLKLTENNNIHVNIMLDIDKNEYIKSSNEGE